MELTVKQIDRGEVSSNSMRADGRSRSLSNSHSLDAFQKTELPTRRNRYVVGLAIGLLMLLTSYFFYADFQRRGSYENRLAESGTGFYGGPGAIEGVFEAV